jgi:hypothetical protein
VSLDILFILKKKQVRGGSALPGANKQKPYAPKYGQGKNNNRPVSFFFFCTKIAYVQVTNFIPVKVSML